MRSRRCPCDPCRPITAAAIVAHALRHKLLPSLVGSHPRLDRRAPSLHPHYQASSLQRARPPLGLASVRSSSWVLHLDFSLRIETPGSHVPHKSLRWAHAVFMPVTTRAVSRHRSSSVPDQQQESGFDDVHTLSTRRQRFTHVRLPSTHLTGTSRLFRNAHDPGHWTDAASGGLDPDPAVRVRGADPHLLCSKAASRWPHLDGGLLSAPSWRTVVRVPDFGSHPAQARFHLLLEPLIEHVMEVNVGQQGTDGSGLFQRLRGVGGQPERSVAPPRDSHSLLE